MAVLRADIQAHEGEGEGAQLLLGRAAARGFPRGVDEVVEMRRHDLIEDVVLGREVMVDQRLRATAGLREVRHRGAVEALPCIEPCRRPQDRVAALVVIGRLGPGHDGNIREGSVLRYGISTSLNAYSG
jgi:hypothetical protein